jgi:cytochrome c oxidase assembly protein subunit 15
VPHQAEGQLHAWIEFGNRLLTFALVAVSIAVLVHVLNKGRRDLRTLALGQLLGILGQGVLGGITVLTDLHPLPVAGHLLLSIILIAGAASLYSRREFVAVPRTDLEPLTKRISQLHIALTFVVIVLGTVVTGSGPHAGDEKAQRFGFDLRTAAFYILVRSDKELLRRITVFTVIALAQGAIGYIQYFTGIPEILVAAHLLGATLVWIAAWRIRITVTKNLVTK